jgi:hypothetical protein
MAKELEQQRPGLKYKKNKLSVRITSQIVILSLFVNASAVFCKYHVSGQQCPSRLPTRPTSCCCSSRLL